MCLFLLTFGSSEFRGELSMVLNIFTIQLRLLDMIIDNFKNKISVALYNVCFKHCDSA